MAFIEKEYDLDNKTLTVTVGGEALEFDSNELSPAMQLQFMLHGMSQKLGDTCAGIKGAIAKALGKETKDISDDEVKPKALSALAELWAQVKNDEWRAARGEGEAKPRVGEVAQAIARLQNIPVEQAQALVSQVSKEKLATWRAHPQMKLAIAQIRQERAAAKLAAEMAKVGDAANFNPNA